MSRCCAYPPPGYAVTSSRKEALIESIKFQKENVKALETRKKDREEKKEKTKEKEKKERRKEKKEKERRKEKKDQGIWNQDKSGIVHGHIDENFGSDAKVDFLVKGSSSESEQLERSSLTEEFAKPVFLRVPSTSSDSTENSNKRKRTHSLVDISRGHGKIIRIHLPSKKQNQPDACVNEQKHCSTSGRTQFPAEAGNDTCLIQRSEAICSTSGSTTINVGGSFVPKPDRERVHVASKQIETVPVVETLLLTPMQKEGLLYKDLMENLAPPDSCVDAAADEDWLFGAKNTVKVLEKKPVWQNDMSSYCNTSSLLWPRAQFLPDVDMYALPYTLPF